MKILIGKEIWWLFLMLVVIGCGNGQPVAGNPSADGQRSRAAYRCHLIWPPDIPSKVSAEGPLHLMAVAGGIDCRAAGIAAVRFRFLSKNNEELFSRSWPCENHQGSVSGLPPATGITVEVAALDSYGTALLRGVDRNITLVDQQETIGGRIELAHWNQLEAVAGNTPKTLVFHWDHIDFPDGVDHFQLQKNSDGVSGFEPVADQIPPQTTSYLLPLAIHLTHWPDIRYRLAALNVGGDIISISGETGISTALVSDMIGTFNPDDDTQEDEFGQSIALSSDGNTLIVGAPGKERVLPTPYPSWEHRGAVYIFSKDAAGIWEQTDLFEPENETTQWFGSQVVLSADGSSLVVTADQEGYIYTLDPTGSWHQSGHIEENFGGEVALTSDGDLIAAGAPNEYSNGGDSQDTRIFNAGAVHLFTRDTAGGYNHTVRLESDNIGEFHHFGTSVALSSDGRTLAVGASGEGNDAGATYIFTLADTGTWRQVSRLQPESAENGQFFGENVVLSADGRTLAVGASGRSDFIAGSGGNGGNYTGRVYLFTRDNSGTWSGVADLGPEETFGRELFNFGKYIALSAEGNLLALAVDVTYSSNEDLDAGTLFHSDWAYVYRRTDAGTFQPLNFFEVGNPVSIDGGQFFGANNRLSLSANGDSMVFTTWSKEYTNDVGEVVTIIKGQVYLY